jgi:large subunit ribosomal protein L29
MAKKVDYRALSDQELQNRLNAAREELMNLRFQQSSGELTDFNRLSITRREIARLLTLIRERELNPSQAGALPSDAERKGKK